jgi:DNA-binding response OmpR family regulator
VPEGDIYDDGFLRIEHGSYYVSCGGTVLYLPRKEFLLLSRLARSIDRIVRSEALWEHAWGDRVEFRAGTLRVYISHLRRKLQPFGLNIKTLISVGYCLLSKGGI